MKTFFKDNWGTILMVLVMLGMLSSLLYMKIPNEEPVTEVITLRASDTVSVAIPVKVTLYQPDTAQCDDSPFVTADNSDIDANSYYNWCAVSRDLMYFRLNFGDTVVITAFIGDAELTMKLAVHDNMNTKWSHRVDILVPNGKLKEAIDKTLPFIAEDAEVLITKIIRR